MQKRMVVIAAVTLGISADGLNAAHAQAYPSRPITVVVPYPAGGPTDTLARILAEPIRAALGQPIVIENISGAGGVDRIGSRGAFRARRLCVDLSAIWPRM